jgi:hypothetical protein
LAHKHIHTHTHGWIIIKRTGKLKFKGRLEMGDSVQIYEEIDGHKRKIKTSNVFTIGFIVKGNHYVQEISASPCS